MAARAARLMAMGGESAPGWCKMDRDLNKLINAARKSMEQAAKHGEASYRASWRAGKAWAEIIDRELWRSDQFPTLRAFIAFRLEVSPTTVYTMAKVARSMSEDDVAACGGMSKALVILRAHPKHHEALIAKAPFIGTHHLSAIIRELQMRDPFVADTVQARAAARGGQARIANMKKPTPSESEHAKTYAAIIGAARMRDYKRVRQLAQRMLDAMPSVVLDKVAA